MIVDSCSWTEFAKEMRMPRLPRLSVPSYPQHITQRGNNRQPSFLAADDYRFYLTCLGEALSKYRVQLHAYVLMTNHVHLLMTPSDAAGAGHVMQSVGRRYVQRFNQRYGRSGTLWEGRYHSSLVQDQHYLLSCHGYIELNPVRAGMVDKPDNYPWSSYAANALGSPDPLLTPHLEYLGLGRSDSERRTAYRQMVGTFVPNELLETIRDCTNGNRVFGSDVFQAEIEARLARPIRRRRNRSRQRLSAGGDSVPKPWVPTLTPN
jgi:putative transposase